MPSSLQSFDGDTLEAALARVTEEYGSGARVTQAEKVRTGGVGGFFARERYEVTVEVDEPGSGRAAIAEPVPAEPMSLLDLVDQVSDQERAAIPTASPRAVPSTEGQTFRDVLRDIVSQAGLAEGIRADGHPGFGPVTEAHTDTDTDAETDTDISDTDRDADTGDVTTRSGGEAPVRGAVTGAAVVERSWFPAPVVESRAAPAPVDAPTGVMAPAVLDAPAPTAEVAGMFRSLGVPAPMVKHPAPTASTAQQLLAVLEGIEPAPPVLARRGDVVAVVGTGRQAIAAAALLADQLGQTADDVVLAGPDEHGIHTLQDAAMAEERVGLWRRCGVPFVVAVCAPAGNDGTGWARQLLAALDPVTVWGAVSAERKPEDIAAWADAVGGVDALAVTGCERTASPAAVLGAGIPVAVLEGRRASPAAWTALLVERLTL